MPRKLYTDIAIIECLEQYGGPMTANEITELTGRNAGTISGRLSQMVSKGQVQVVNLGHMPRLYIKAPPGWTPPGSTVVQAVGTKEEEPTPIGTRLHEQIIAYMPEVMPDDEPDFSDPEPAKNVWSDINDQWALIFDVHVTDADCELMVKLANRHVW